MTRVTKYGEPLRSVAGRIFDERFSQPPVKPNREVVIEVGDVAGVRQELAAGVSPNLRDECLYVHNTPLHVAAFPRSQTITDNLAASCQIISLLIEKGADGTVNRGCGSW